MSKESFFLGIRGDLASPQGETSLVELSGCGEKQGAIIGYQRVVESGRREGLNQMEGIIGAALKMEGISAGDGDVRIFRVETMDFSGEFMGTWQVAGQ